ncbi:right-handed parallel beta-helix repeat-containing protein [Streptomyces sp. NBC_00286]|uniref:right-handed parallel beta-helix repeat-containing protein n=1 Tax=Streptomyces sp. NBC_00286 TaxID=2975701 RepID=UPI002E2E62F5|nr:right-handed parallel beta-helix repeat-containing protein [Streptomyces sp. NBC_00286]
MLTLKKARALAVAVLLSVSVAGIAIPATAKSLPARQRLPVPCEDVAELIKQVNEANTRGRGTIVLSSGCSYELTAPAVPDGTNGATGLPIITGQITITGSRATITRQSATAFRIAEVAQQGSLTLNGITVSGGSATGGSGTVGGGILTEGTLRLVASRITGNTASVLGGGIAVVSGATARLAGSIVSDNRADDGNTAGDGGGIHVGDSARLTVQGGSIQSNTAASTGGGLATFGTTVLGGTTVRGNRTENFEGGGIITAFGPLTLNGGRVTGNEAATYGGGIANLGLGSTLRLRNTTVDYNVSKIDGGGLYHQAGTSVLVGGRVFSNHAGGQGGGIFRVGGSVVLTGAPVVQNTPDNCAPSGDVPGCTQ